MRHRSAGPVGFRQYKPVDENRFYLGIARHFAGRRLASRKALEDEIVALALLGSSMMRTSTVLALCGVLMSVAPAGLGENSPPPSVQPADAGIAPATRAENGPLPAAQPTFYQDLARADAMVDATAAQSMISGYRRNNRLEPLAVDPELMRIASEQARAMAARNAMDHEVGRSFQERCARAAGADGTRDPALPHRAKPQERGHG